MKINKLRPFNSYYHFRQQKVKQRRLLVLASVFGIMTCVMLASGRFKQDALALLNQPKVKSMEVYLSGADVSYHLYKTPTEVKGVYIPQRKVDDYEDYIELAKETDVNSFVIDVKNDSGYLTFATENPELIEKGCVLAKPPITNLKKAMARFYEEGIYPIARIVAFKDSVATAHCPELAMKDLQGNVYQNKNGEMWLDPYNKQSWAYLVEVSKEAIHMGFKEVQLDYVRFYEGMDEETVQLGTGQTKTQIITEFIKYICEELHQENVFVSADVFGTVIMSQIDAEIVGQDFAEMSKYLDYICPMVYPSHYAQGTFGIQYPHLDGYGIILRSMEMAVDKLKQNKRHERMATIRPWLQDFTIASLKPYRAYGEEEIKAQIQGAYDAGIDEWLFWNAAGKYTEAGLNN